MLKPWRAHGDNKLFARATPQWVTLTETYSSEQDVSANSTTSMVGSGTGRIEVHVPYDGRDYFTRQAVSDVRHKLGSRHAMGDQRATIGHLLLGDHGNVTGLDGVMRAHQEIGLIPLNVPVASPDGTLDLTADRETCVVGYDYQPEDPRHHPIRLIVTLDDVDTLTGAFDRVVTLMEEGYKDLSQVIDALRQEASVSGPLRLRFWVRITIPVKANYWKLKPVVTHMSVKWPTLTSVTSMKLHIGGKRARHTVRFNPKESRLEWEDVAMWEDDRDVKPHEAGPRVYVSEVASLEIEHPGDLFKREKLEVKARVEVPHYLLSGLEARLFDATGRIQVKRPPSPMTRLTLDANVYPADIFAGRSFSPYHQFVFDDIVPEPARIIDLKNVLRSLRFEVPSEDNQTSYDPLAPTWLLTAQRSQGPEHFNLVVAVDGKRTDLDREQILHASTKLSGRKESGHLKVSVWATLPRDHQELTRELNAFQQALRARYRFYQTSRR